LPKILGVHGELVMPRYIRYTANIHSVQISNFEFEQLTYQNACNSTARQQKIK